MKQRPLHELNPEASNNWLRFDCPSCASLHSIRIPIVEPEALLVGNVRVWWRTYGSLKNLTVEPSIDCNVHGSTCTFHGTVVLGVVSW